MESVSRDLDPWYVTGFSDGEGSFTYSRSSKQIALYFAIKLTASDRPLLVAIQEFFGVGKIYGATKSASMYRVTRHDELPRITDHFDAYPLHGEKRRSYEVWREMVACKRLFRNVANADLLHDLAEKLSSLAPRNQPGR